MDRDNGSCYFFDFMQHFVHVCMDREYEQRVKDGSKA